MADPYLGHDCVLRSTEKSLDFEFLFDPLEQLDLNRTLEDAADIGLIASAARVSIN